MYIAGIGQAVLELLSFKGRTIIFSSGGYLFHKKNCSQAVAG